MTFLHWSAACQFVLLHLHLPPPFTSTSEAARAGSDAAVTALFSSSRSRLICTTSSGRTKRTTCGKPRNTASCRPNRSREHVLVHADPCKKFSKLGKIRSSRDCHHAPSCSRVNLRCGTFSCGQEIWVSHRNEICLTFTFGCMSLSAFNLMCQSVVIYQC